MAKNLEELRREVRLRDVVGLLTGSHAPARNILCPFHPDTDPSLSIYRVKDGHDRFLCRSTSCGKKGDVFDFIQYHEEFTNHRQALDWIQEHKDDLNLSTLAYATIASELDSSYEKRGFWEKFQGDMRRTLMDHEVGKPIREWFISRGVDERTLPDLPVGCFDYKHFTTTLGYNEKKFKHHGMPSGAGAYPGTAAAFFYYNTPASLSRIKLRIPLEGVKDRHLVLGSELGKDMGLFGLNLLAGDKIESLTAVEGEFDVLVPQSKFNLLTGAFLHLVCMSGSTLASEQGYSALSNLRPKRLRLWPDNDDAGRNWVGQAVRFLQMPGLYISVVWPKDYGILTGEEKVDPADYCTRINQDMRSVIDELMASETYVANWLATLECARYNAIKNPGDEDLVRLQESLLNIVNINGLTDLTLANFLDTACKMVKALTYDVLWRCAVAGYSLEPPTSQTLGGVTYVSTSSGYVIEKPTKNDVIRVPISDFRIKIDRWVRANDPAAGGVRTFAECRLLRAGMSTKFILTDNDMRNFQGFRDAVHAVDTDAVMDSKAFRDHYDEIIRLLNRGAETANGTLNIGLTEDCERYIMPNYIVEDGRVIPNNTIPILLETYNKNPLVRKAGTPLVDDPDLLQESAELITGDMMKVHTDKAALICLLAHIVSSPVVEMLKHPRGVLLFEGAHSAGKTVTAQLFMNLAWDYPLSGSEGNVSFASTINSIEMQLAFFKGLPLLVDDAKDDVLNTPSIRGQVLRMIQAYYDRQGRGRLSARAELKQSVCIQGHLIITGESLPLTAGSAYSRMIVITLQRGGLDIDLVNTLQCRRRTISYVWPHYIAYLQRLPELRIRRYADRSLGRLGAFVDYQATSLQLFLNFLVEECNLDPVRAKQMMSLYTSNIPRLLGKNQEIQGVFDDATLFIDTLAQLIHRDTSVLEDQPGIATRRLGYKYSSDIVAIYPTIAMQQVGSMLDGRTFNMISLGTRLREAGYVETDTENGTTRPGADPSNPNRARVWLINRARLFEGLGDPGQGSGRSTHSFGLPLED